MQYEVLILFLPEIQSWYKKLNTISKIWVDFPPSKFEIHHSN